MTWLLTRPSPPLRRLPAPHQILHRRECLGRFRYKSCPWAIELQFCHCVRSVHGCGARPCIVGSIYIAAGLQCVGIALPGVTAVRFKLASFGEQIARQICMAGTDCRFDQYLREDVTLGMTCTQSMPLLAQ